MNKDRKDQEYMIDQMRELAKDNPDKIVIVETSVDPNIQIEFFEEIQKVTDKNIKNINVENSEKELFDSTVTIEDKKKILVQLVTLGEVESYRLIEKYLETADDELKTWAYLACQQAKMFLESKLLEETKIYVASGLGGKDHRLRYSFALKSKFETFDKYQKDTVKGELEYFFKKEDCILEDVYFQDQYAIANCLVPIFIDIIDLLQVVLKEINEYGDFLYPNVFITNEKKINATELEIALDSDNNKATFSEE